MTYNVKQNPDGSGPGFFITSSFKDEGTKPLLRMKHLPKYCSFVNETKIV